MAKLEGDAPARWQLLKKFPQSGKVLSEERRQLEQEHAEFVPECTGTAQKLRHVRFGLAQTLVMGDAAWGFQGEGELLGDLFRPLPEHRLGGHAVEGIVDLDGWEMFGVVAQHLARGEVLR